MTSLTHPASAAADQHAAGQNTGDIPTVTEFTPGHGLWLYLREQDDYWQAARFVREFNSGQADSNRIRYIYLSGGGIEAVDDRNNGRYQTAYFYSAVDFHKFRSYLPDQPGLLVFAMFECNRETSRVLDTLKDDELRELGKRIAVLVNDNAAVDGLHFDLEPHNRGIETLVKYTRQHLHKPLSMAIGKIEGDDFFHNLDIPVLMNYDHCVEGMTSYSKVSRRRAARFFNICRKYRKSCQLGISVIATHCEKNTARNSIADYFRASLDVYQGFAPQSLGLVLYALDYKNRQLPEKNCIRLLLQQR